MTRSIGSWGPWGLGEVIVLRAGFRGLLMASVLWMVGCYDDVNVSEEAHPCAVCGDCACRLDTFSKTVTCLTNEQPTCGEDGDIHLVSACAGDLGLLQVCGSGTCEGDPGAVRCACDEGYGGETCMECLTCDDRVDCTLDLCAGDGCQHEPDDSRCATGEYCDPLRGCLKPVACASDSDCPALGCATSAFCDLEGSRCEFVALDVDGDGSAAHACGGGDCDESRADVNPFAAEVCNGIDDDCDGVIDPEGEAPCGDGYRCEAGNCLCPESAPLCGTTCKTDEDFQEDDTNCGVCGNACEANEACRGGECYAIDCELDKDFCGPGGSCNRPSTPGASVCECADGFALLDSGRCVDIDECLLQGVSCGDNERCQNTPGKFECVCVDGYSRADSGSCVDVDECAQPGTCAANATCQNTAGSFNCTCDSGYRDDAGACVDVDECSEGSYVCLANSSCRNTVGFYECPCNSGFELSGSACVDVNECQTGAANCGSNQTCVNTTGSFRCDCVAGYASNGAGACTDINECQANPCRANSTCQNTTGSYTCPCQAGFQDVAGSCADIDECAAGNYSCPANSTCQNTPGSYGCPCVTGYQSVSGACVDVDECATTNPCGVGGTCQNADGAYACVCQTGYQETNGTCSDVDECQTGAYSCQQDRACSNLAGGYLCVCPPSAYVSGSGTCNPAQLAVGLLHACFLFPTGQLKCWGWSDGGLLGFPTARTSYGDRAGEMGAALPTVDLGNTAPIAEIATYAGFSCARFDDGRVKCWGSNYYGQLGQGHVETRGLSAQDMGDNLSYTDLGGSAKALAHGDTAHHACAILTDDRLKCWGWNAYGQLGLGDVYFRGDGPNEMGGNLPNVDLGSGLIPESVAVNEASTCVFFAGGRVKCWGGNGVGQLGLGDKAWRGDQANEMGDALPFVDLGSGRSVKKLAASIRGMYALLDTGEVKGWGEVRGYGDGEYRGDEANEMGDNLPTIDLGAGRTVQTLAAGLAHVCAVLDGGALKCWGRNIAYELGVDPKTETGRGSTPGTMGDNLPAVPLGPGATVADVSAGAFFSCALLDDGRVKCWGRTAYTGLEGSSAGQDAAGMGDNLPAVNLTLP